jgi:hypothetical protein
MNLRFLLALNFSASAEELATMYGWWESGVIEPARFDGDTVASLRLTTAGAESMPPMLPTAVA